MMKGIGLALTALAFACATPARAQEPPQLTATERALQPELAQALAEMSLPKLDALLAKLTAPTAMRGAVQLARAGLLMSDPARFAEASAPVEEALRLLPQVAGAKFLASYFLTFNGAPERAADLWIAGSEQSPREALDSDEYLMGALRLRLREKGDHARADRLEARMGEIGYSAGTAATRSAAALAQVRAKVAAGNIDDARGLVSSVLAIGDAASLFIDRRYQPLWATMAEWGGPRLENQHRLYLEELRREWQVSGEFKAGTVYARTLLEAGEARAVIDLFLPRLSAEALTRRTPDMEFLSTVVSRALVEVGRAPEALALFDRVERLIPDAERAQKLNPLGNAANVEFFLGNHANAVTRATDWLERAKASGELVNGGAVLTVRGLRACALILSGRAAEATEDIAAVLFARRSTPGATMMLYACRNEPAEARNLLIESLADEGRRSWALQAVQPAGPARGTPVQQRIYAFGEEVRKDPAVLAAAAKVGRVLPEPLGAVLPPGFDPAAPSHRRPQPANGI